MESYSFSVGRYEVMFCFGKTFHALSHCCCACVGNLVHKTVEQERTSLVLVRCFFTFRLSPEFLLVSGPLTQWCASTLGAALLWSSSLHNVCIVCIYLWSLKLTTFMNEKSSACLIEWNDWIITIIAKRSFYHLQTLFLHIGLKICWWDGWLAGWLNGCLMNCSMSQWQGKDSEGGG